MTRQAVGAVPIETIGKSGKDSSRGNCVERAIAESFKNAAESFEICSYLDLQADDRTKRDFASWMSRNGNNAPATEYHRQQGNLPPKTDRPKQYKPSGVTPKPVATAPTLTLAPEPQPTSLSRSPNQLRLSKIKEMSGQEWKWIKERGITLNFPADSALLSSEQVDRLRDECFVQWALKVRPELWKHEQHCRNSYVKTLTSLSTSAPDEKVWEEWAGKVFSKDAEAVTEKAF
ncbi:hypothetical protein HY772_05620 [Candidatus Woesearchaeota archaeon]|nr:hypothetical protein [Candidatus Woesearchaeota archaeon]